MVLNSRPTVVHFVLADSNDVQEIALRMLSIHPRCKTNTETTKLLKAMEISTHQRLQNVMIVTYCILVWQCYEQSICSAWSPSPFAWHLSCKCMGLPVRGCNR